MNTLNICRKLCRKLHRSLLVLSVLSVLSVPFRSSADIIFLTLSVTNQLFGTTNGNTLTVNADTRTATNNTSGNLSTMFAATNNPAKAATNLYRHLQLYNFAGIHSISMLATNQIQLNTTNNGTLSFSLGGTWGVGVLSTSVNTRVTALGVDPTLYDLPTQTNFVDKLVKLFNQVGPTNAAFAETVKALTNYVSLSQSQTLGNKTITNSSVSGNFVGNFVGNLGALTNGTLTNTHLQSPLLTNGQNYGAPFRSPGGGSLSEQFGTDAVAATNGASAFGNSARALGIASTVFGGVSTASNLYDTVFGGDANATGGRSLAVGPLSSALSSNSTAVGHGALVDVNLPGSTALGYAASATDSNQVRLGTSINYISIPGNANVEGVLTAAVVRIASGTLTNISAALIAATITNLNLLAGTLTNVTLAASAAAFTNLQALAGALTNFTAAFSAATVTNLQGLGGSLTNVAWQNSFSTNATLTGTSVITGSLSYPAFNLTTLAIGNNISVPLGTNTYIRLAPGTLVSSPTICGMVGGATTGGENGEIKYLFNDTGFDVVFAQNTVDPVPANRINNYSGLDFSLINQGSVQFIYDTISSRWKISSVWPQTNTAAATVTVNPTQLSLSSGIVGITNGASITNLNVKEPVGSASAVFTIYDTNGVAQFQILSNRHGVFMLGTNVNGITTFSNAPGISTITTSNSDLSKIVQTTLGLGIGTTPTVAVDLNGFVRMNNTFTNTGDSVVLGAGGYMRTLIAAGNNGDLVLNRNGGSDLARIIFRTGGSQVGVIGMNANDSGWHNDFPSNTFTGPISVGSTLPLAQLHVTNTVTTVDPLRIYTQAGIGLPALTVNSNRLIEIGATANTNTPRAGAAAFFAETNATVIEMAVIDSAGNVTQISPHPRDCPPMFLVTTNWVSGWPDVQKTVKRFSGTVEWQNRTLSELVQQWNLQRDLAGTNFYSTLGPIIRTNLPRALFREESFATYNARLGYSPGDPRALVRLDWDALQLSRQTDYNQQRTNEIIAYNTPLIGTNADLTVYTNAVNTNITIRAAQDVTEPKPPLVDYISP